MRSSYGRPQRQGHIGCPHCIVASVVGVQPQGGLFRRFPPWGLTIPGMRRTVFFIFRLSFESWRIPSFLAGACRLGWGLRHLLVYFSHVSCFLWVFGRWGRGDSSFRRETPDRRERTWPTSHPRALGILSLLDRLHYICILWALTSGEDWFRIISRKISRI